MSAPTYLVRDRHGAYLFRIAIPKAIRSAFQYRHSLRQSLQTYHRPTALRKARRLAVEAQELFDMTKKKHPLDDLMLKAKSAHVKLLLHEESIDQSLLEELVSSGGEITPELEGYLSKHSELEEAYKELQRQYLRGKKISKKIAAKIKLQKEVEPFEIAAGVESGFLFGHAGSEEISGSGANLSQLWEEYRNHKIRVGQWKNENEQQKRKIKEYDSEFVDFMEIVGGDIKISRFDKELKNQTIDGLLFFPKNRKKMYAGVALECIPQNALKISASTASQRLDRISAFFKYLYKEELIRRNWFEGERIERNSKSYPTPTERDIKEWFNLPDELIQHPWQFWIPRIAILMGARQNEIAQLTKNNIGQDDSSGIWYITITDSDDESKSTKTKAAQRKVPVHQSLIDNGFLKYINSIQVGGSDSIWPPLKQKGGKWGGNVSKYWTELKNKHHVLSQPADEFGREKVFHSLRRVILNRLAEQEVDLVTIQSLVGHEPSLGASGTYIDDPAPLPRKKRALDKLSIPSISWKQPASFK